MKSKIIFLLILCNLAVCNAFAQRTCWFLFWTDDPETVGAKVYVGGAYMGQITAAYRSAPSCGASGAVESFGRDGGWEVRKDGKRIGHGACSGWQRKECDKICVRARGGGNTSSGSSSSGSSGSNSYDEAKAMGAAMLVAFVAITVPIVSNDIYFNYTEGPLNRGFNFGFRNSMNKHIDLEYGAGFTVWDKSKWMDAGTLSKPVNWSIDFNALYNILEKQRKKYFFNPYIGFGSAILPIQKGADTRFAFGGIAGVSFGGRFKGHVRYKWLRDWAHNQTMANQIEIGFTLTYKYGWKFSDQ